MQLTLNWKEDLSFEGSSPEGHKVYVSNERDTEDQRIGFSPLQLLALGLGSCSGMDTISILQKKRQAVEDFEVRVSYEQVTEHPRVWSSAHIEYTVKGKDIDPQAVERAIQLSVEKYCAAYAMLSQAVEISTSYKIVES